MRNVTGGGAYANKEVDEKSQAGSCFVRKRIKPYIHQLGKSPNIRKERMGTVQTKFKKGEGNYHS